ARSLYCRTIAGAGAELAANNVTLAEHLLESPDCAPALRGWEWHYLKRLRPEYSPRLGEHDSGLTAVAYHPDGRHVLSADLRGEVRCWRVGSAGLVRTWSAHAQPVRGLAVSPDGRTVATAGADGRVKLWDWAGFSDKPVRELAAPADVHLWCVAFDATGTYVAAGGGGLALGDPGAVVVWEVATGREACTLRGQGVRGFGLAFSPTAPFLATARGDKAGHLWERPS